jgi:hypothetical protein
VYRSALQCARIAHYTVTNDLWYPLFTTGIRA